MKRLLGLLVCLCHMLNGETIRIAVTSESPQKIAAVKTIFESQFPEDNLEIHSFKTISGVPEQPVGKDVALLGTKHRVECLPSQNDLDYIISIENFIECEDGKWNDMGLVLIKTPSKEMVSLTRKTPIPENYVELAKELSRNVTSEGFSMTVGKAIQTLFPSIDPQDWHQNSLFGSVSREILLEEAIFKALHADEIAILKDLIIPYVNFPKPGVTFEDFFPLLQDEKAFQLAVDLLYAFYKDKRIERIVGLESRGFILGAALAYKLGVGFTPVRKPGKLPCPTYSVTYQKEYGVDTLVISQSAFNSNLRTLVIDDLIATGGSAKAAIELVRLAGGTPVEFVSLLEVKRLNGRSELGIPSLNLLD